MGFKFRRSGNNVIQTPSISGVVPFKYILRGADKNGDVLFETIPGLIEAPRRRPETREEFEAKSNEFTARLLTNSGQRQRKGAPADEMKAKLLKTIHTCDEPYTGPIRPPGFPPMAAKSPSSAERLGNAAQSSVCHGSLNIAVPPVNEHDHSSHELYPGPLGRQITLR